MRFLDSLIRAKQEGKQIVIPDIKRYSPKEGELLGKRTAADYAKILVEAGAPVVSVVTEEKEFHGSLNMLKEVADAVDVPILRKDFIHTKEDLQETLDYGASAILLMCSCLEEKELEYLYHEALKMGLDPFVETHKKEDFELVRKLGAKLVGINNRDILKLEKDDGDVSLTEELSKQVPKDAFLVTESSIKNQDEVRRAIRKGAGAALVGTAILKADDPDIFYRMLTSKISLKICGCTNEKDIRMVVSNGVSKIGMVVEYPLEVPWNISSDEAMVLRKLIPSGYRAVLVVGGENEKVLEIAKKVKPDMMQLHFNETLEQTAYLSKELKKMGIGVIQSVPLKKEDCVKQYGTDDIETIITKLCETDIEEILVDPRKGEDVAKKNLKADEELFQRIKSISSKPVVLAGGINSDNISDIILRNNPEAIDVMNGSEDEPGQKNREKIRKLACACY